MGIELISTTKIKKTPDLYKVVDVLNKALKYDDLMFGLAYDDEDDDLMIFSIYRTRD
jgi:hypothetical protein